MPLRPLLRRALVPVAAGVLLTGLLAACGGDDGEGLLAGVTTDAPGDSTTTTPEAPEDDADAPEGDADAPTSDFCVAAADIADLDETYGSRLQAALSPLMAAGSDEAAVDAAVAAFIEEMKSIDDLVPALDAAYADLLDAAPADVGADIELVRDYTRTFVAQLAEVRTLDDLERITEEGSDEMQAAGLAAFSLDQYTRDECGFSISNE